MRGTKFYAVWAVALVLLVAGGIFGFTKYSDWSAARAARLAAVAANRKAVAVETAAVSNVLKTENAKSEQTFAQLFDRVDAVTKKSDDSSVEVQASDADNDTKSAIAEYFGLTENALRAIELKYRKALDFSNKIDSARSATHDYVSTPYNEYSDDWERRRMADARSEMSDSSESYRSATQDCIKSLEAYKTWVKLNADKLNGYSIVDPSLIEQAIKKSRDDLNDLKKI